VVSVSRVFTFHPLAERYPIMRKWSKAFKALVKDVQAHGLRQAIVLFEGKILDGRNRALACQAAGIEPHYRQFDPAREGDPMAFVDSANSQRRHLTSGQRVRLASEMATGTRGGDHRTARAQFVSSVRGGDHRTVNAQFVSLTVEEAAAKHAVSPRSVYDYRKALKTACVQVDQALEEGRISVRRMGQIAKLSEDKQLEAVKDWEKLRDEHPEAFKRERGLASDAAKIARVFDAALDGDKAQFLRGSGLPWWRDHRHEHGG
jgi:hypothetical protein